MKHTRKFFTKRKTKAGVLGANEIPFLLKQKISEVHNATHGQEYYNSTIVDNILSHLPIQGVNEAITEDIIQNPVTFPTWSKANYSKILLGNFLAFSKKRRAPSDDNYILSRIPNYELQRILTTNKFFIIDVDFLIKKFNLTSTKLTNRTTYSGTYRHKNKSRLQDYYINSMRYSPITNRSKSKKYKSYSAYISKKITDIIFDHLLASYQAYWAIKHTIKIIIAHIKTLRGRQPGYSRKDCRGRNIGSIVTDTNINGETKPFREVWHATAVGRAKHKRIRVGDAVTEQEFPWSRETPETTNISPFDVLEYYILILNKELDHLANYKISIVESLITSVNVYLHYIENRMADLYGCFDAERPPLSFKSVDDINFAVFKIIIPPFKEAQSLKLTSPMSSTLVRRANSI